MIELSCKNCKKIFKVFPYRENSGHFCSIVCYHQFQQSVAYPILSCGICKKNFRRNRRTRYNKYCRNECVKRVRRKYEPHKPIVKECPQCGKIFQRSPKNPGQTFCSVLCQIRSRALPVNAHFFSRIDSEGKAYMLGLMYSDGNISRRKNAINISSNDMQLMRLCRQLLSAKRPIYRNKNGYMLTIQNATLKEDLAALGVRPRKSYYEMRLPSLPERLMKHFIRGIHDGDGSFFVDNRGKYRYLCFAFTSNSKLLLSDLKSYLASRGIPTQSIRRDEKADATGSWLLRAAKKDSVKKFVDFLYKDSVYYLDRKRAVAKHFYE